MPTQVSETPEVESHYATQTALTAALLASLRRLWPTVKPLSGPDAAGRYREGVAAVVDRFALASISLSADFYEDMRDRAGVDTPYRIDVIAPPPRSLIDAGIDWAMSAQAELDQVEAAIQQRVEAAMQKAVADAGRSQIMGAIAGDEKALGFARVAHPGACAFCLTLAFRKTRPKAGQPERPGVYKSRDTAGQLPPNTTGQVNRYHNNCHCTVVPIFDPNYTLEPHLADLEDLYEQATENSKRGQSLNDFRKALEAVRRGQSLPGSTPREASGPSQADQLAALLGRLAN